MSIQRVHKEIKEENEQYRMFNKKVELRKEHLDKKNNNRMSHAEKTFVNLVNVYKEKGYKIPNLSSTQKNLFKPSPLLTDNSKLVNYYQFFSKDKFERERDQHFITGLGKLMTDKALVINNNNNKESLKQILLQKKFTISLENRKNIMLDLQPQIKLDEQNANLESENNLLRRTIQEKFYPSESEKMFSLEEMAPVGVENTKTLSLLKKQKNINSIIHDKSRNNRVSQINTKIIRKEDSLKMLTTDMIKTTDLMSEFETARNTNYSPSVKFAYEGKFDESKLDPKNRLDLNSIDTENLSRKSTIKQHFPDYTILKSSIRLNKIPSIKSLKSTTENFYLPTQSYIIYTEVSKRSNENISKENFYVNKNNFLEYIMDSVDTDNMPISDMRDVIAEYSKNCLKLTDKQIEDKISKKTDPTVSLNMIHEIKNKIDNYNIKEKFVKRYNFTDVDRLHKLDRINDLDKDLKRQQYELIKRLRLKND